MSNALDIRIFRSPRSDYYGDEVIGAAAVYTDEELAAIAAEGFNGIWLRAILRDLTPTDLFRGYGSDCDARMAALIQLIGRAAAHGIGVWLYLNEPMALPADSAFWQEHPDCRGMRGSSGMDGWPATYAMCSSAPRVRQFLHEATYDLFTRAQGLAGLFLITAAEHHTHCYSHVTTRGWGTEYEPKVPQECPRCAPLSPAEVICDIAAQITDGATAAAPSARVMVWSWRWSMFYDDPHEPIISQLPTNILLMSNFEDGQPISRGGRELVCREYSLGIEGPSPLFVDQARLAQQRGIDTVAKLQIGTTHELATVPNLPAIPSLYRKFRAMRDNGLTGYLGTWNFGCSRTLNTWAVGKLSRNNTLPTEEQFLRETCAEYFGSDADAGKVVQAWQGFTEALQHHPMNLAFLYFSPLNYTLAYPWPQERGRAKMARSWTNEPWGDDLGQCLPPYSLDEVIQLLGAANRAWSNACASYHHGLAACQGAKERVQAELASAHYTGLCFTSAHNLFRWYRGVLAGQPDLDLIDAELACCARALPLLERWPQLGFHQECQHRQCSPALVQAKMRQLEQRKMPTMGMTAHDPR
ncbi:MAG: hypothetical protein WD042_06790 [Phycisphaeraceae bacterium]